MIGNFQNTQNSRPTNKMKKKKHLIQKKLGYKYPNQEKQQRTPDKRRKLPNNMASLSNVIQDKLEIRGNYTSELFA